MSDTDTTTDEPGEIEVRKVEIEAQNITKHADAWTNEEIAAIERESIEYWSKIEDPEKRAIAVIARDCLIRLMENPLEWLPTSLKPESGSRMMLFVYISIDEVEKEVVAMREQAEKELYQQVHDIARLKEELDDDQPVEAGTD